MIVINVILVLVYSQTASNEWSQAHQDYRCKHATAPLEWSSEIAVNTKKSLINCDYVGNGSRDYGENIFQSPYVVDSSWVVSRWYSSGLNYNYTIEPNVTNKTLLTFTQMLWMDSTQFGCSTCDGSNGFIAVCRYSKRGNVVGKFTRNVHQNVSCVPFTFTKEDDIAYTQSLLTISVSAAVLVFLVLLCYFYYKLKDDSDPLIINPTGGAVSKTIDKMKTDHQIKDNNEQPSLVESDDPIEMTSQPAVVLFD